MELLKISCLTILFVGLVESSVLPVDKCNLEDSDCMTAAFQKALPVFMDGMPELDVEVLDVLEMDDFEFELSGLHFELKQGRLKGLKNSIIDNVKWDLKKEIIEIDYHVDCTVKGHYTASGMILILPITGDGEMKLKLKNIEIKLLIDYKMEKGAGGKDHVALKKLNFTFEVRDNANFNLTNLFNGNKELSDTMLTFLNENWKQISTEFGRPMMEAAAKKIFKNIGIFFEKIPIEDIANI